jgi:hypothetical protein
VLLIVQARDACASGLTLNGSLAGKKAEELALINELQEHVKSTTAPYKYPRKIDLVDSLPKVKVSASQIVYKYSVGRC